ncbi:MAG: anti-sigma factor RsbA family regulatory protein, partial [Pseudonocardiaceae bacterium]
CLLWVAGRGAVMMPADPSAGTRCWSHRDEVVSVVGSRSADEFVHRAFFYRGTAEYLKGTVPFIREGLLAGEPVAVAVPGPNLRLILNELGSDAARVRLLDMTRAGRNPGRLIPSVLCAFADAHPTGRVRIIGEHRWSGGAGMEYPACAQHEALINTAFAGRGVTILCPYDVDRLGPQTLTDAQACHPLLIDASGQRVSTAYAPQRLLADRNQLTPPAAAASLSFDVTNQALARQFASDQATRLGLDGDHAELKLIVGELTANSFVHGGPAGTLSIWVEHGYLVCEVRNCEVRNCEGRDCAARHPEVRDPGHTVDPLIGRQAADLSRSHSRGLLINYLSDLVLQHTSPQGSTTRVYLKLPSQSELANDPSEPIPAPRTRRAPSRPTPLPWQTYEALHAAERFGRYLPQDATANTERPVPASNPQPHDGSPVEPVLEALTAVETLARVVDRWRARLVRLARTRGAPWTEIGHSLGVSKQAAHERYGQARRRRVSRHPGHVGPLPPVRGA